MSIASVLRESGFFGGVSDDLLFRIASFSKSESYGKGDLIFAEGNPCAGMYVVGAGAIKIYKIGPDGREHVLHVAEPGDTFGEAAIFLGETGYPAYAGAVKRSSVVFIPKRRLIEMMDQEKGLCFQVLASLATWTHRLVGKLELIALKDASSRLAAYIKERAKKTRAGDVELQLSFPKQTLAAHLGISSETLSRMLTRFEAMGLIATEGRLIRVRDPKAIQEIADWGAADD